MSENKIVIDENQMVMKFSAEESILKNDTIEQLRKLWKEKKYNAIIDLAKKALAKLPTKALGEGDKVMSEICFLLASSLRELGQDSDDIKKYAFMSANFNRLSKNSMWLIREINNQFSDKSKIMRLQVVGDFFFISNNEEIKQTFKTIYSVVSESEKEALEFIKEFEREEIKNTLRIDKSYEYEFKPELPKGVYETMKLFTWVDKDDMEKPN